jgi:hypothetical protein
MHKQFRFLLVLLLAGVLPLVVFTGCDSTGSNGDSQNQSPTASATVSSSMVDVGTQVVLDGSSSSDPDGDDLTFSWTLNAPSGSNAQLSNPSAEQPTFTPDVEGSYTATLEVSDGNDSDTDDASTMAEGSVINSNITSDRTLSSNLDHLVTANVCVENGATLTIEAGTQILFESSTSLQVCSDNSALVADGTENDPISMTATSGNETTGWWNGVGIFSSNPNNSIDHTIIRHAGGTAIAGSAANVTLGGGTELSLSNSEITDSGQHGVYLDGEATLETTNTNTYSSNEQAALSLPFANAGDVNGNSSFEEDAFVRIWGGSNPDEQETMTVSALASSASEDDTPYRFASSVGIQGSAEVTIEAGTEMQFAAGTNISVNSDDAQLVAEGTPDEKIRMTATPGNETTGWWDGVGIFSSNQNNSIDHAVIRHGGGEDLISGPGGAANVTLRSGKELSLSNSEITDSGGHGVYLDSEAALNMDNNTYGSNSRAALNIPFANSGDVSGNSSFGENSFVRVSGTPNPNEQETMTVSALAGDTPYRFANSVGIQGSAEVTIEAGTEMEFTAGTNISVNSDQAQLVAEGTPDEKIQMTATPGNEEQGHWNGVGIFSSNPNNSIDHAIIRHGGGDDLISGPGDAANVTLRSGKELSLSNSEITDSGQHGVYCDGNATLSASSNTFTNISGDDVNGCQ